MNHRITVITAAILGSVSCTMMGCSSDDNDKPVTREPTTKIVLPEPESKPAVTELDAEMVRDIRLLRRTMTLSTKPPLQASSGDAAGAAARVFALLKLIGMSKEEALSVLGDPATISDYGRKAGSEVDAPLIYRFDSGRGGYDYRVEFKNGKVVAVKIDGLN